MRGIATTLAFVVPMLSVAGCASSHHAGRAHEHLAHCATGNLILGHGAPVVPMTGEHAVMYALTNRSSRTCTLRGYPGVTLFDARGLAMPFRYAHGGGTYVTSHRPGTIVLAHGASAYVLVAKYRCDQGIARNAATIRLALPAAGGRVFTAREPVGIFGPPGLSYCRGGPHGPGQLITVSPIERTWQATSTTAAG